MVINKKIRLRNAFVLLAESCDKDADGNITTVYCSYDKDTLGCDPADGVKPKGVIHWVSAVGGKQATVRLYDRLFNTETPGKGGEDFVQHINSNSLEVREGCWIEPSLVEAMPEQGFQFERQGYFVADRYDHNAETPVFNRTIGLRDSWAKMEAKG